VGVATRWNDNFVERRFSFSGSSEEFVGKWRFGQLPKRMIQSEFQDAVGAKALRSSDGDFGFVV